MSTHPLATAGEEPLPDVRAVPWTLWRPLFEWFFCYPLLFVETAALLLIVMADVGDPLSTNRIGLPSLFWHESLWVQFTAGLGIALVFGEVCLVGYLLDAERNWMRRRWSRRRPTPQTPRTSWWYFFGTLTYPTLVVLAALPAVYEPETRWGLPAGLLAGTVAIASLSWLGRALRPEATGMFDWMINFPKLWQSLPPELKEKMADRRFVMLLDKELRREVGPYYHLHAFQMFVSIVLVAIYLLMYVMAQFVSPEFVFPAVVICVLLALMTIIYGFIVFHFPLRHFGVFLLIVLAYFGIASLLAPQYQFAGLDYESPTELSQVQAEGRPDSGLLDNQQVLDAWRSRFGGSKPVLVVVAVKGGGARSAAWTTTVLTRLEQQIPQFPYHTRLISGVSGGMLGATYYVATLNPPGSSAPHTVPGEAGPSNDLDDIVNNISEDSLSPVVRHLALPLRGDRGAALEAAWEKNTADALAEPFVDLRSKERAGWLPSLVFSPMLVEDGRLLLISNLDLDFLVHNRGSLLTDRKTPLGQRPPYSISGWQFFELFPYATNVKLSTIARMNASFPYISPDAELATDPPRRVIDAAFYDRYGVNLAALWIHHCREWIRENTAGVILVQIRDRPRESKPPSSMSGLRRALSRFTTPIEAAIRARAATMSFRNDKLVEKLDGFFNHRKDKATATKPLERPKGDVPELKEDGNHAPASYDATRDFFTTVVFEYPDRAPLSWYLPPEDLRKIKEAVANKPSAFTTRLKLLQAWWARRTE